MNNGTLAANGLPRGHNGHDQHDQDQHGGCLPQQVVGVSVRDKTKVSLPRANEQHPHEHGGRKAQRRGEGEEGGEPAGAAKEVAVGGAVGARSVGGPPVQLVDKNGANISNNLGGTKREAVIGQRGSSH